MSRIAGVLIALSLFTAPVFAESIKQDGPKVGVNTSAKQDFTGANKSAKQDFTASNTSVISAGKKTNFGARGGVSMGYKTGGGR